MSDSIQKLRTEVEVEQVYSLTQVEKVYSQKYSDGERRTAVDDFEECLNKI